MFDINNDTFLCEADDYTEDDNGFFEADDFRCKEYWIGINKQPTKKQEYRNAKKAAENIDLTDNSRTIMFTDGSFILGDFIEAFFVNTNCKTKHLHIATLSFNQENIDSLFNLVVGDFVEKITLTFSHSFYAHERHKNGLVPYLIDKFKKFPESLQIVILRIHCKIVAFETTNKNFVVMHGSGNLRSSDCIEQMMIDIGKSTYDAFSGFLLKIEEEYKTIDLKKRLRIGNG